MYIPKKIMNIVQGEKPQKDQMGMSGSHVYLFSNWVLKIHETQERVLKKEYEVLRWLKGKLPVPNVLAYIEHKTYSYLLMTKLLGVMTCDPSVLEKPYEMIKHLAKGLKMLWNVDTKDCPFQNGLLEKLKTARRNIDIDDVDVTQAEENTYGEKGFKDPEELYQWLVKNQPPEELVFTHGDYCLPNVFVDENDITGFIDFDRTGIACRWADMSLVVRSIYHNFGHHEAYIDALFHELDIKPDWDKIRYYILLDELL